MEDHTKLIESLYERAVEYSKTSYELLKLKTLDKSSNVVSTFTAHSVVFTLIVLFMLFSSLGLAFWLGEILGKVYYGFFVLASFYGIIGLVLHFFFHKQLKRFVSNYFINQVLK